LGNIFQFPTLDLLDEVEKELGFRVALDDLARATLGIKKSGHGLLAIEYFNKGELEKLKNYCLDDVFMTRQLYEYGRDRGILHLQSGKGTRIIKVSFNKKEKKTPVTLSIPL
jgi:DEAD/DEAH box helicase domain-containing protein